MIHTDDQDKALISMLKWSKIKPTKEKGIDSNSLLYTLNGAAGTGKTTIIKAFLNGLKLPTSKIAVTAPTHKAKKVIQEATNFKSQTIQKLLGLRPNVNMDDFDINKPVFLPLADDDIRYFKYVIIDESSMLNKDAFNLIKQKALDYNIKIIFLGR